MSYYFAKTLSCGFAEAIERTVVALRAEGFGVLSDIDVQATLKSKLNVDMPPYRILGACNPPLAHRALEAESSIGLMLPCNVVVRGAPEGTEVLAIDPGAAMGMINNPALRQIAEEVGAKLKAAIASL